MTELTIIIPHYNSWDMLQELLYSIPDYEQIEIIVIDDASLDASQNLKNLKNIFPKVIFLNNDNNKKGAGSARNKGLKYAKGKWVLFADADDLFTDKLYDKVRNYLESDKDIVYFKPSSFNSGDKKSVRHQKYKEYVENYINDPNKFNELKLRFYFVVPWSKLIRKSVIDNNKIQFEEIMYSNDVLFSAKVGFYALKIAASNKNIYSVRESANSLTSNTDYNKFVIRFDAWRDYILFLKKHLSKEEINMLNLSAMTQLVQIKQKNLGVKELYYVFKQCIENKIPILDKRLFNIKLVKKYIFNR